MTTTVFDPPLTRDDLWQCREAALASPAYPVLLAAWKRGVEISLTLQGGLLVTPRGAMTAAELAILRQWPHATRMLVAFATADRVAERWRRETLTPRHPLRVVG